MARKRSRGDDHPENPPSREQDSGDETTMHDELRQQPPNDQGDMFEELVRRVVVAVRPVIRQEPPQRVLPEVPGSSRGRRTTERSVHSADGIDFNKLQGYFMKRNPPKFQGGADPIVADMWLNDVNKIFLTFVCPKELKVSLIMDLLVEDAGIWWEEVLQNTFDNRLDEVS